MSGFPSGSAAEQGLACCHTCHRLSPAELGHCPLCGAHIHLRNPQSLERTLALLVTAIILYFPANILPIMTTEQLGDPVENTILGGVVLLIHHGSYAIAGVIFVASVMVPIGKLISLSWLCWAASREEDQRHLEQTKLYRATEFVGKWSMTDVFVVAVLVGLIQFGTLLQITPGPGAVAFGGVVITTMLAAESFDTRLLWDRSGGAGDGSAEGLEERG